MLFFIFVFFLLTIYHFFIFLNKFEQTSPVTVFVSEDLEAFWSEDANERW